MPLNTATQGTSLYIIIIYILQVAQQLITTDIIVEVIIPLHPIIDILQENAQAVAVQVIVAAVAARENIGKKLVNTQDIQQKS